MAFYETIVGPDGVVTFHIDGQGVSEADFISAQDSDPIVVAQRLAQQAEADRQAALAQPITPLPISGSTVSAVKASADASVKDLATQMQAKIDAILGGVCCRKPTVQHFFTETKEHTQRVRNQHHRRLMLSILAGKPLVVMCQPKFL